MAISVPLVAKRVTLNKRTKQSKSVTKLSPMSWLNDVRVKSTFYHMNFDLRPTRVMESGEWTIATHLAVVEIVNFSISTDSWSIELAFMQNAFSPRMQNGILLGFWRRRKYFECSSTSFTSFNITNYAMYSIRMPWLCHDIDNGNRKIRKEISEIFIWL